MRPYPCNSPEAAGRVLALALMADGDLSSVELSRLEELQAHTQLGLRRPTWHQVLHEFCADLLQARRRSWDDPCRIDPLTLSQLLAEVDDPALRENVLALCLEAVEADHVVTDGEWLVLSAAVEQWGMHRHMLAQAEPA
ncbi:MAG: TerB family tellurite resistance protein [Rubrivivax sp.]|nr:TerB family tellurite resistance protein [Rubrivivax sp.]